MLSVFFGSDRERVRDALASVLKKEKSAVLRVTDAHTLGDLEMALRGPGMFGERRVVVLDSVFANPEMQSFLLERLDELSQSEESFHIVEGSLDAATKKLFQKHAKAVEQFDLPKKTDDKTIFALANALQRGDKKALWIGLMREYAKGGAPEAIHGLLFWGAKQLVLRARTDADSARGRALVATLAELPHAARRRGEELGYALERFVLSGV